MENGACPTKDKVIDTFRVEQLQKMMCLIKTLFFFFFFVSLIQGHIFHLWILRLSIQQTGQNIYKFTILFVVFQVFDIQSKRLTVSFDEKIK